MIQIDKAAVVGAGVMGGGIAAHLANAGIPVLLLDVVPEGAKNRSVIAERAIEKLLKSEPPALMHRRAANSIIPANVVDHLDRLAEVDWIIEAVVEDLETKRALYKRIERFRKEDTLISSNTSTLSYAKLVDGLPERFRRDFLIAHFFNPPRYVRLLELVASPDTRPGAIAALREFADHRLGKTVLLCRDTPGFVANRIGAFWIQCAIAEAIDSALTVEEADSVMSRSLGIPKTGIFGLLDLIGLDLILQVDMNLAASLPPHDAYQRIRRDFPLLRRMVEEGYTGRKGEGGFYRLKSNGDSTGLTTLEALDLESGTYRSIIKPTPTSLTARDAVSLRALVEHPDKDGRYAWAVLSQTLAYVAGLIPEIADSVDVIDRAIELGYNWKFGPFKLIDQLGADYLAQRLRDEGRDVPALLERATVAGGFYQVRSGRLQCLGAAGTHVDVPREEGILLLSDVKLRTKPLAQNGSASLWDIGDGIVCLEVHTKMNTIDPDVLALIRKALDIAQQSYKSLVIYNESEHFSAGANLGLLLFAANIAAWRTIEELLVGGQETLKAIKYSPFPVVAASAGLALGGGCELLLHCNAVQAHAESYIGLVETSVGLVPAWGGCKELLSRFSADPRRPRGPMPPVALAYETIGLAKVAKSAFEARDFGFLRPMDEITFNRDRLLADAKAKALELAASYRRTEPAQLTLPGPTGKAALYMALGDMRAKRRLGAHDEKVADALAEVLSGGPDADLTLPVSEDDVLALERQALMSLLKTEATLARMEHTLSTGKPLRN